MANGQTRIHTLPPAVARRIAAGEVIERPHGVVRELLDNSLDAGARSIEVHLGAGGNELIRVVDDGVGMSSEDLELCVESHTTSKIATDSDLQSVTTLGFRGEALASVAAVSRLSITTAEPTGTAHALELEAGRIVSIGPSTGRPGTTVAVRDLFYNVPARKQFLKRPQTEGGMCRNVFLDRSIGFPDVEFRLFRDGELRQFLPVAPAVERISAAYPERSKPSLLEELQSKGDGFSFSLVAGEPHYTRSDRRHLQIFVNGRRVWEYALVQAVEYAYRDYMHGGRYPIAYLFLSIEPQLVDFNIHPAKREVRFRNLPAIHRQVVDSLGQHLRRFNHSLQMGSDLTRPLGLGQSTGARIPGPLNTGGRANHSAGDSGSQSLPRAVYDMGRTFQPVAEPSPNTAAEDAGYAFRYLGQVLGVFLVVELEDKLYLVDQHAAHERIIYDRLKSDAQGQELLFPIHLDAGSEEAATLASQQEALARMGIGVEQHDHTWELVTVPSTLSVPAEELAAMVMDLADRPADFERELYASIACRAAIMDGDPITPATACEIIQSALELPNPRCPHGRPVWTEFSREALFKMVGRT